MADWLPPKDHHPKLFVKLGQRQHMEAFLKRGVMRFGTLKEYGGMGDPLRGDPLEGVDYYLQPHLVTVQVDGEPVDPADLTGPITSRPEHLGRINAYCMYLVHPGSFPIPPENEGFGDAAVIVKDGAEFLRRLLGVAEAAGHSCQAKHVEYVSADYHGRLGPFRKLDKYCKQNEWRFLLLPGTGAESFLEIGSLEDIADLVDLNYVNAKVEFRNMEEEVE